jgi:hypothetical protein
MQNSTRYVPHWLRKALDCPGMVRISFPHGGQVLIDPVSRKYDCDFDGDSADFSDQQAVEIKALPGALLSQRAQPLPHLLWTVQLKRLQAELKVHPYEYQANMLRLISWPCMVDLPPQALPLVARICALLSHRPTSALLIPTLLDLPAEQVYPVLEVLHVNRCIKIVGEQQFAEGTGLHGRQERLEDRAPAGSSFVEKLWQRLRVHSWSV